MFYTFQVPNVPQNSKLIRKYRAVVTIEVYQKLRKTYVHDSSSFLDGFRCHKIGSMACWDDLRERRPSKRAGAIWCLAIVAAFLLIVLLPLSLSYLEYYEYGIIMRYECIVPRNTLVCDF
jgi:hypothetical protein